MSASLALVSVAVGALAAAASTPQEEAPSRAVEREMAMRAAALTALAEAVRLTEARGLALDAPWGQVQVRPVGAERLAVHGADGDIGVLNAQRSVWSDEASLGIWKERVTWAPSAPVTASGLEATAA